MSFVANLLNVFLLWLSDFFFKNLLVVIPVAPVVTSIIIHFMFHICCTWSDSKVRELIAVKVLHTSLLNTTVVAFKVLPLGSYVPMPAPSPPFKTNLELVLWNGLQSCLLLLMSSVSSKCLPFNISFILGNRKKSLGTRSGEWAGCSNTVICLVAKNSLTNSAL